MLKNVKIEDLDEITGEMIKNRGEWVSNWLWTSCNIAFESE